MITEQDKQKNKSREPKTGNNTLPDAGKHKKVIPRDDKFSPGEPDDYNAEEFATD